MNLYQQAIAEMQAAANRFGGIKPECASTAHNLYAYPKCTITVPSIEVTLHPEHLDPRDVHFDQTGFITDEQVQRAYTILAERHSDELDAIARQLVAGEIE